MPVITGKTVYVLGAGASHHTGIPLLGDFLFTARLILESNRTIRYKNAFDLVFSWIDAMRGSSYYVELDLNNLEHIFSLAEMERQINPAENNDIVKELRYLISETIDNTCQIEFNGDNFPPDKVYGQFVNKLQELNEARMKTSSGSESAFDADAVITFNYDVMLDNALHYHSLKAQYFLNSEPVTPSLPGTVKLLKLHGSINWGQCQTCAEGKRDLTILSPIPVGPGYTHVGRTKPVITPFKMATEILARAKCKSCHKYSTLEPFLVAPTWSKKIEDTPITNVWKTAVSEISDAFQLVVIGYSMPRTDTFFQYLLTLGLAENPKLHRVIVVDVDKRDDFRGRYEKVFSRSLSDRGGIKVSHPSKI